ncbi:3-demethylubiquinone-9 3-methyltransferase [Listeria cornellensis FSL F6-0969]|uniref:3-demethylubiquinone-9 3-methyltransferase n=1 Tax=Listeria cornellensis FSL F6-0969 TaxID=1265820 RepID=W7BYA8_9LIST|nr:hypothetical protein [Listeria cornellensis]EUJ28411.1 3-demethylubiquinone-9 3-methyltransferase [Listeria cornellensis FSL F6-0969]
MFSDTPDFMEFIPGNNVTLVLDTKDAEKLTRYFDALSDGATKIMPLQKNILVRAIWSINGQIWRWLVF